MPYKIEKTKFIENLAKRRIGTHISKNKTFFKSISEFYNSNRAYLKPVQIFTGSPKFWRRPNVPEQDIEKTREFIDKHNLSVFIHSIYLINLSKSPEEFREKAKECLIFELEFGEKIGFKGVVVHCGKSLKLDKKVALDNMYNNIIEIYNSGCISNSNPLLIETSAGQGTEVCTTIREFMDFYSRFTEVQMTKIKICIDTCHVFAAGHESLEYLEKWNKRFPGSIVLVHYNDSKVDKGSKKDRHAYPGEGYIGKKKMLNIADFCMKYSLPMVIE